MRRICPEGSCADIAFRLQPRVQGPAELRIRVEWQQGKRRILLGVKDIMMCLKVSMEEQQPL